MYRFDAVHGRPAITWRKRYPNIGVVKPGQTERGSGTTPTLMGRRYVTITDNADPMDVLVYRRGSGQLICRQPVFDKGASDTDQSLIANRRAIVVENNYGYSGPSATLNGGVTSPGLERRTRVQSRDAARLAARLRRLHDHPTDRDGARTLSRRFERAGSCS